MNLKELYQEIILDHGKNPRNLRKTDNFNKDAKGYNPLCGDKVHVYLKLNENKKVEDISFEGSGCAISMASASIMTDLVRGKEEIEVKEIVSDFEIVLSEIGKDIDKRDYIVSNEKVEKRGFCPKYTLEDGINELVKFYKFLIPDKSMRNI